MRFSPNLIYREITDGVTTPWRAGATRTYLELTYRKVINAKAMKRPIGVTILAIINGLQVLLLAFMGVATFFLSRLILEQLQTEPEVAGVLGQLPPAVIDAFPKVLGIIFLVLALANGALAVGLWALKSWAWYLNLALQGLGIFGNLGGLLMVNPISMASIAFSAFYIYYFLQQPVQEAFGIRNVF